MSCSVSTLLERVGDAVWRADALALAPGAVLSSGHAVLDAHLPGGGWPVGALCEILQRQAGQHEWCLLLPVLRQATQLPGRHQVTRGPSGRALDRQVLLIGAPYVPFAPGLAGQSLAAHTLLWVRADSLAERLWAAEQALRCAEVAALLLWLDDGPASRVRADHLRRLHLGAQAHAKLLFVMRAASAQGQSSPAVLRLLLGQAGHAADTPAKGDGLALQLLKRRGPPLAQTLYLPAPHAALATLLAVNAAQRQSASLTTAARPCGGAPCAAVHRLEPSHALDCIAGAA